MNAERTSDAIIDAFQQLDGTEQMIFLAGVRGLSCGVFDIDGFTAWMGERVRRHRAGEALCVSDLDLLDGGQVQP